MQIRPGSVIRDRVFKVFIDFDGTIAKQDVGDTMFYEFGNPDIVKNIIEQWDAGKIGSSTAFTRMSETLVDFSPERFSEFIDAVELNDGFIEFVQYCEKQEIDIKVLSDGLDIYIKPFFEKHGLSHLKYYSNKVTLDKDNKFILEFTYTDEECKLCANCKRNHIISGSSDDEFTVYIGDGHSDKCGAQFCDYIFAKDTLLKHCEINRITYFPFRNFREVQKKLNELVEKKRLKKKLRAELKRKEIYKQG